MENFAIISCVKVNEEGTIKIVFQIVYTTLAIHTFVTKSPLPFSTTQTPDKDNHLELVYHII